MSKIFFSVEIVFALWGGSHLLRSWRGREGPEMRRTHLLAGTCGLSSALALACAERFAWLPTAIFAVLAAACGIAWLYALYTHSLHNTSM